MLSDASIVRPVRLPWELLSLIYSYCDVRTLVALCLVSFGSWETAVPILYEDVHLRTWNGLLFCIFIDLPSPTSRLGRSPNPLSSVRTLTLHCPSMTSEEDTFGPRPLIGHTWTRPPPPALLPARLPHPATPLSLPHLILHTTFSSFETILPSLFTQLFPHINPQSITHHHELTPADNPTTYRPFPTRGDPPPPSSALQHALAPPLPLYLQCNPTLALTAWTSLSRVVFVNHFRLVSGGDPMLPQPCPPLYAEWARLTGKRLSEVVLDYTSLRDAGKELPTEAGWLAESVRMAGVGWEKQMFGHEWTGCGGEVVVRVRKGTGEELVGEEELMMEELGLVEEGVREGVRVEVVEG